MAATRPPTGGFPAFAATGPAPRACGCYWPALCTGGRHLSSGSIFSWSPASLTRPRGAHLSMRGCSTAAGCCGVGPGVINKVTTSSLLVSLDECFRLSGAKAEQRKAEVQGSRTHASQKPQTLSRKTAPLFTPTKAGGCLVPEFPGHRATVGVTVCGFNCSRRCEVASHRGLSLRFLSDE